MYFDIVSDIHSRCLGLVQLVIMLVSHTRVSRFELGAETLLSKPLAYLFGGVVERPMLMVEVSLDFGVVCFICVHHL